ncbi:regulator of G-protein signaling 5-like [Poeciliopsis prolifica]|uniref:regulator of G-protein signaling 5-like n=1 Tax=Poeciliopsis prolifica TaxID=188132 RepID=UPI002413ABA0|nr:regulator of G-protein signaling 5-like [Poeciliopsis prolifica]
MMSHAGRLYKKTLSPLRRQISWEAHFADNKEDGSRSQSFERNFGNRTRTSRKHLTMCRGLELLPISCLERAKELKALFGSLLQRSEQGLTGQAKNSDKQRLHEVNEPLKWKESFDNLLSSQNGLCLFRAFLVSEFSEENIAFYLACEDFRTSKPSKLAAKAKKIYKEFVCSDAPREVNLDHATKQVTRENMTRPSPSCFDQAQDKIYTLMEKDCYPRFLRSSVYLDLTRETKTG